jgi:hypothetical protein
MAAGMPPMRSTSRAVEGSGMSTDAVPVARTMKLPPVMKISENPESVLVALGLVASRVPGVVFSKNQDTPGVSGAEES